MDAPISLSARSLADDTFVFPAWFPLPGLGVIPMSSFLIRGKEPMLVDTGAGPLADGFMSELEKVVDLDDLRWIWLTHTDPDHIGAVSRLIERAPNARFVTTFLGAGKMSMHTPLPPERTHLVNPGGRLSIGDREVVALRPPVYDAPETVGLFDPKTRTLFAADTFGTLLGAPCESAHQITPEALTDGMLTWASIDAPWLQHVSHDSLGAVLAQLEGLGPEWVLSSHLPPARGMTELLATCLVNAAGGEPFVGPDQAALEAAMAAAV